MSMEEIWSPETAPADRCGWSELSYTFLLRDTQQMAKRDALIKKLIVLCVKIQILQYHMNFERFAMVRGRI